MLGLRILLQYHSKALVQQRLPPFHSVVRRDARRRSGPPKSALLIFRISLGGLTADKDKKIVKEIKLKGKKN